MNCFNKTLSNTKSKHRNRIVIRSVLDDDWQSNEMVVGLDEKMAEDVTRRSIKIDFRKINKLFEILKRSMTIRTSRPAETTWVVEINMRRFNVQIIKDLHASRISSTVFICAAAQIFFDRFTVEAENERDDASRERSQVKKRKGQHRVLLSTDVLCSGWRVQLRRKYNSIEIVDGSRSRSRGQVKREQRQGREREGDMKWIRASKNPRTLRKLAINRRNNHFYKMSRY